LGHQAADVRPDGDTEIGIGRRCEIRVDARRHSGVGGGSMKDYPIKVFYSDEDGGSIADIPDLESCSAFGRTPEEAVAEVGRAKEAWLRSAREEGKPIPEPRYKPVVR
jgi:predicted RNase H-like HicB family nuclease